MKPIYRRGQAFAMDLVIATVLFIGVFVAFYGFVTYLVEEPEDKVLAREGNQVATALARENSITQIIVDQELNVSKLDEFAKQEYDIVRGEIGVKKEFCIYLEDDEGNLIQISDDKKSFGSKDAELTIEGSFNPVPCDG